MAPTDGECGELAHCGRRLDSMGTGKQGRRGNRKGIRDGLIESVTPGRHWLGGGVFIYILGKNTSGH